MPSWLAYDRTLGFLEHTEGWRGFKNNVGRFGYKNYYVAGPLLILVALSCVPALFRSLRDWGNDHLVRVGFLCLVGTELLFLQVPWKPAHLLPAVLMFVLWVAATDRNRRPFLFLLIAAIAVNGIIAIRPLTPDRPDESQTADFHPTLQVGPFLNDVRCRLRYMDVEPAILDGRLVLLARADAAAARSRRRARSRPTSCRPSPRAALADRGADPSAVRRRRGRPRRPRSPPRR